MHYRVVRSRKEDDIIIETSGHCGPFDDMYKRTSN